MKLKFESWLGFLNLQLGVMFSSASLITMAIIIMVVNMDGQSSSRAFHASLNLYVFLIILIWTIAFFGSYLEQNQLIFISLVCWSIFILSWMFLGVISNFSERYGRALFSGKRTAVSLWLYTNQHSKTLYEKVEYFYHSPHYAPEDFPVRDPFVYYDVIDSYPASMGVVSKKDHERKQLIAILIFSISFTITAFLLVTEWILLYSYYRELKCKAMVMSSCTDICRKTLPTLPTVSTA